MERKIEKILNNPVLLRAIVTAYVAEREARALREECKAVTQTKWDARSQIDAFMWEWSREVPREE